MFSIEKISSYLRNLPVDARIEVIIANLIYKGVLLDDLIVQPVGISKRRFHKDWEGVKSVSGLFDDPLEDINLTYLNNPDGLEDPNAGKIVIAINREGLYDYMPEGIIHQPHYDVKDDPENLIKEIKEQRIREQAARKFFLPIEQEFYRLRIGLELDENQYFITPENIDKHELIQQFWDIPFFLSAQQICNLVYLLPLAHKISGDFKLTELCFESILNVPVSIRNGFPIMHDIVINKPVTTGYVDEIWENGLGDLCMGLDFVLSGGEYQETIPSIILKVGPVSNSELGDFMQNNLGEKMYKGTNRMILDYLVEIFMPYEADTVIEIVPAPRQAHAFVLDNVELEAGSHIGFDAYL